MNITLSMFAFVAWAVITGGYSQTTDAPNRTGTTTRPRGNRTKIRPYDLYHAREEQRKLVLKETIFNTVCPPVTPVKDDTVVVTEMTVGKRGSPGNTNFEFEKVRQDYTIKEAENVQTVANVTTLNDCVEMCTAKQDCLTYAYEDGEKRCKLCSTCKPEVENNRLAQVFSMTYWYQPSY